MSPQNSAFSPLQFELDGDVPGVWPGAGSIRRFSSSAGPEPFAPGPLDHRSTESQRARVGRPFCGIAVDALVVVEVLALKTYLAFLEGRTQRHSPAACSTPHDRREMGAHHHVDLVGSDARRLIAPGTWFPSCPIWAARADFVLPTQGAIRIFLPPT